MKLEKITKKEFKKGNKPWNTGKKIPELSKEKHPNWKNNLKFAIKVQEKAKSINLYDCICLQFKIVTQNKDSG